MYRRGVSRESMKGAANATFGAGGGLTKMYASSSTGGGGGSGGGGGGGSAPAPTGSSASAFSDVYKTALDRLSGGGMLLEANLADIEAGKQSAIARGEQNVVQSGLSGSTIMAGVPIAAEKAAGISRLKARGAAEEKYLSTLTSFANLAMQAEEGRLNRQASASNLQTSLASQERTATANRQAQGSSLYVPESERRSYGAGYDASGNWAGSGTPTAAPAPTSAEQYPSLYGSGGQLPSAPSLSEPAPTPYVSGQYTSGSMAGMTSAEIDRYRSAYN